uniref:Immunoglobulin C1-set domain-containing protein n=1 Tax=Astyanax mexicanus TaxID=7994 RepID=A0A3B1KIE6_ASTMX
LRQAELVCVCCVCGTDCLFSLFQFCTENNLIILCSETDREQILWSDDAAAVRRSVLYVEGTYEGAVSNIETCKSNLANSKKANNYPAEPKAHVGVSWTRNNVNVTRGEASLSRYYVNDDGSFNLVSALSFTPEEGRYLHLATVEARSPGETIRPKYGRLNLQMLVWERSVFCGVGLAAGLLESLLALSFSVKGKTTVTESPLTVKQYKTHLQVWCLRD